MRKRMIRALLGIVTAAGAIVTGAANASAAPMSELNAAQQLQAEIDATLRDIPGGTQISQNEIAWRDGTVIMTFALPGQDTAPPSSDAALSAAGEKPGPDGEFHVLDVFGCPEGTFVKWYCFYEDINHNKGTDGRRLQFSDHEGCYQENLFDWHFANQTSSWVNTADDFGVRVLDLATDSELWWMPPNTTVGWVGSADNDRADLFRTC